MSAVEPTPVPAPVRAERIPHAAAPVRLPEVRAARASYWANIITGAVLLAIAAGLFVAYFALELAS